LPLPLLEAIEHCQVVLLQLDVSGLTTEKYLPHDPVPIHSGYVLGVYQPGILGAWCTCGRL